jgi:hypothetical protein
VLSGTNQLILLVGEFTLASGTLAHNAFSGDIRLGREVVILESVPNFGICENFAASLARQRQLAMIESLCYVDQSKQSALRLGDVDRASE